MPKHVRSAARELALALLVVSLSAGVGAAQSAANGLLGIFFDAQGTKCEGTLGQGGITTLYIVLVANGDTRGGIAGGELRVEAESSGYRLFGPHPFEQFTPVGDPFGSGVYLGAKCQSGVAIPIYSFQVQNLGGSGDGVISITPPSTPSNPEFPCALVLLCDTPAFTKICVRPGKAVLNPTGSVACGSGAASSEWGRVKELYR